MKKTILITRPKRQAQAIANSLQDGGFEVFVESIFEVNKINSLSPQLSKILSEKQVQALILTSANAAEVAFALMENLEINKKIKIFAVGKKTAEKFLAAGYENVIFSKVGGAKNLLQLILANRELKLKKKQEILLYFCGDFVTMDFQQELQEYGYIVEKIPSYKIIENEKFSEDFLAKVKKSNFDFVLLYSQNSAKTFFKLAKKHNLLEYFQSSRILCLSEKILSVVRDFKFQNSATFDEISILKNFYE